MAAGLPVEARSQPVRQTLGVPPKRLLGPARRQPPRLDDERTERTGDELDDHDVLEDVDWTGGAPASVTGVEIIRSRLTGITFTGLELAELRLLDVELVECELSGAVLTGARWERVVLRRCRMSGIVAAELQATDVRLDGCKADQAWLRASRARPVRARRHRPARRRPLRRAGHAVGVPALRPHRGRRDRLPLRAGVAPRLHRRPPQGSRGAAGRCTIGSDQLVPLALPILAARGITVDDDAPDLVDGG